MPTPKTKRDLIIDCTLSSAPVATLSLGVDALFNTPLGTVTVNLFQDSSGAETEATEYQMTFGPSTGQIGAVGLSFTGQDHPESRDVQVVKTRVTSDIDPPASTSAVTPIANPDAGYARTWQQEALDASSSALVNQVGGVDIRVKAGSGYTVTQTVTSTAVAALVLTYSWKDSSNSEIVSGTVTFTASAVAGTGYTLGPATVRDATAGSQRNGNRSPQRSGNARIR